MPHHAPAVVMSFVLLQWALVCTARPQLATRQATAKCNGVKGDGVYDWLYWPSGQDPWYNELARTLGTSDRVLSAIYALIVSKCGGSPLPPLTDAMPTYPVLTSQTTNDCTCSTAALEPIAACS